MSTEAEHSRNTLADSHKAEWAQFRRENLDPACEAGDYEQARTAKTLADAIRLTQDGERRAFEFGGMDNSDNERTTFAWATVPMDD